ncbi:hypothetical protein HFGIMCCB_00056 [Enterobacteria phage Whisky]|nr:hypothetical protein HFGIMCCB_00056 [Enterobacteria phage Whisky]
MWVQDIWYTVTKENLELFMKTGSANADIAESLIDAFESVDKIRFKVGVNLSGQVTRLYAENGKELHHRLEHHLGLNYWFEPNEVKYFTPEINKLSTKLEAVLNLRPINVDGYIIKNIQDWELYLDQVIRNSKQEAANKKRQEIKQLKAELEAKEKELAELVK